MGGGGGTSHLKQLFAPPTNCRCLPRNTKKKHRSVKSKNDFCTSLMASPNSNGNAPARPNDSMTSTSVALRQRWLFFVQGSWAGLHFERFSGTVSLWRPWLRRLAMSGQKAREPDAPKSVEKKKRVSALTKCGSWPEREMRPTIAKDIGRAPSNVYTLQCIAINR